MDQLLHVAAVSLFRPTSAVCEAMSHPTRPAASPILHGSAGTYGTVSLVMATFQRTHCLAETVAQLLDGQTRPPLELIVVNNDPTPGAEAEVRAVLPLDPRLRVVTCTTGRQGASRNLGLTLSTGDYVAFVDDDDDYGPEYVQRLAGALDLGLRSVRCQIQTCGMASPDCTGTPTIAHHPLTPNTMARREFLTPTWKEPPGEDRDYWQRHPVEGAIDDCLVFTCRGPQQHSPRNAQQGGSWRVRFLISVLITSETARSWSHWVRALQSQRYANFVCLCWDHSGDQRLTGPLARLAVSDPRFVVHPQDAPHRLQHILNGPTELKPDDVLLWLRANERLAHDGVLGRLAHVYTEHQSVWATYGNMQTEPPVATWPQASFPPDVWQTRAFRRAPGVIGEFTPLSMRAPLAVAIAAQCDATDLAPASTASHADDDADLPLLLAALEAAGAAHVFPMLEHQVSKSVDFPSYRSATSRERAVARQFEIRARAQIEAVATLASTPSACTAPQCEDATTPALPLAAASASATTLLPQAPRTELCTELHTELRTDAPVLWVGPFDDPSGYGNEARGFVRALDQHGTAPILRRAANGSETFRATMAPADRDRLDTLLALPDPSIAIGVLHLPPSFLERLVLGEYMIARTMFETDGLTQEMVARCNLMDEIWVPSSFNQQTFQNAGVRAPLVCIPGAIHAEPFCAPHSPYPIPGARGTVYLSTVEWKERKGWQVLLTAWAQAFTAQDDVTLVFRSSLPGRNREDCTVPIDNAITAYLASCGMRREDVAPIIVMGKALAAADIPRLYAAANAYVAPSSGEGWGYPYMEAMASGLPTIATNWSAHLEYMHGDNSLLCDVETMVPAIDPTVGPMPGQRWAKPSARHLAELLRVPIDEPIRAAALGARAQQEMRQQWNWDRPARLVQERLREISGRPALAVASAWPQAAGSQRPPAHPAATDAHVVRWEGAYFAHASLGLVNRELVTALMAHDDLDIIARPTFRHDYLPAPNSPHAPLADRMQRPTTREAAVHVGHQWPPMLHPPAEGSWVLVQPWEFGGLPGAWLPALRDQVDEYWVYCNWQRDCAIASGVPAEKVAVIPLGADTTRYRPDGPRLPLRTTKRIKFLAVGGVIPRKGMDLLVKTYLDTFTAADDVCLVIKGLSSRLAYHQNPGQDDFAALPALVAADGGPEIEFIGETLSDDEIAALYRACDIFVAPFRGEGFGLPIAEAMASALPVIVTHAGPTMDLCDDTTAYLIPATQVSHDRDAEGLRAGLIPYWLAEPDLTVLAKHMRTAATNLDAARSMGRRARQRIEERFTFVRSAAQVATRLRKLAHRRPCRLQASAAFTPSATAFPLDQPRGTIVLFQPEWHHSNWRDVLQACHRAYEDADDVSLVITLDPAQGLTIEDVAAHLEDVRDAIKCVEGSGPDILVIPELLTEDIIASLYRAADHVILEARDVAGRSRAAAMGLPVVPDLSVSSLRALLPMPIPLP